MGYDNIHETNIYDQKPLRLTITFTSTFTIRKCYRKCLFRECYRNPCFVNVIVNVFFVNRVIVKVFPVLIYSAGLKRTFTLAFNIYEVNISLQTFCKPRL
jgi:hypothetical protein